MREVTQIQVEEIQKQSKEEFKKIIDEGGKITKTEIHEKDRITTIIKIEPVNGKATSSKTVQTKNGIETDYCFIE